MSIYLCTGDPECQYTPGEGILTDHRSQMMAFCGHELYCMEFNSPKVLAKAKENLEKFYSVVGVVEDMNKTLTVLEHHLPEVCSIISNNANMFQNLIKIF